MWVGASASAMAVPRPPPAPVIIAVGMAANPSRLLAEHMARRGRRMEDVAPDPSFAPTQLAARAAYLLRGNDLGAMTTAAPLLYPHMWSWDAAFVAVGLAPLSVERAVVELDTLLSAQWGNGMIPHIVFASGVDGYFPGPARWACSALAVHAPRSRHTSGITQPPVHAIAVQRILDHARSRGRSTRAVAEAFLDRRWDDLVRWHRWLAEARDQHGRGRITLYHGWESGMDNSPRWDSAYANVIPVQVPEYQREDNSDRDRRQPASVRHRSTTATCGCSRR